MSLETATWGGQVLGLCSPTNPHPLGKLVSLSEPHVSSGQDTPLQGDYENGMKECIKVLGDSLARNRHCLLPLLAPSPFFTNMFKRVSFFKKADLILKQ